MKLKIYLVMNKISITSFCKLIGCSRMHLNDIVNGKRRVGKSLAKIIELTTNGAVTAEELLQEGSEHELG